MNLNLIYLLGFLAYLLGSIPSSVWIGKFFYKVDVREFGSGNAGATNTFRVLGKKAGVPVLVIDILKGSLAVGLAHFSEFLPKSNEFINLELGLGIMALIGHIFPIFANFKGGKGVATILGAVLFIVPNVCCFSLLIFLIVLLISRIVSLSSIIAGIAFPIFFSLILHNENQSLKIFSFAVAILLIVTHRKNIQRMLKKEESKINLFSLKSK